MVECGVPASPVTGPPAVLVDTGNSSTTPLTGGATFTGTAVDVSQYARISVFVDTDAAGTLKMQFSSDGTNWDRTKPVDIDPATLGDGSTHTLAVATQYFRVLLENGASAQTHLRLETMYHNVSDGVLMSSVDQRVSRVNDVQLVRTTNNFQFDMARNLYRDRYVVHKFGSNPAVPSGERDIWLWGATSAGNINYPWPTAAETVRIRAGGNAADTAAGAGARSVTIEGLDENWALASETVATAGASASSATTTTFIRVYRAYVAESGTYGAANTGAIIIENTSSTNVLAAIQAARGQTQISHYTVPDGYTAYLRAAEVSVDGAANKELTIRMYQRRDADNTSSNIRAPRLVHESTGVSGEKVLNWESLPSFPGKTDLWWTSQGVSGSAASVDYDLWLAVNEIVDPQ